LKDFKYCSPLTTATYKAGIYDWAAQPRPYPYMMIPQPPPVYVIPGMKVGCMPYDAMIESTLECWYSEECLNVTASWISRLPANAWPKSLNSSKLYGFSPKESMEQIADRQMVDEWQSIKNFSAYYSQCSPIECTYSFQQRNNFIYLISLLISLYGGLTISLRFLSPCIVQLIQYVNARIFRRKPTDSDPSKSQQSETY
jgi:hypothetical protein